MRLDRLLSITVMLLNRKRISAQALADHFGVTVRTIYRDVEAINLAGIPVVSFQGNQGGFSIMENYSIDRQVLTLNDIVSVVSILKGMNRTFQDKKVDAAIEKITSLVPRDKTAEVNTQVDQVVIDVMPWGYRRDQQEKLQTIQSAISKNRVLKFKYTNSKGEKIVRTVEPMTLLFKEFTWYLFAYCQLKKAYRLFRWTRMKQVRMLKDVFIRRSQSYHDYAGASVKEYTWVTLTLKFAPKLHYRVLDYYDEKQVKVLKDGSLLASARFPEDDWIYSLLLSYGEDVEVIGPLYIRETLQKKARKVWEKYQTGSKK